MEGATGAPCVSVPCTEGEIVAGARAQELRGSQEDQAQPLAADKIQRQRDEHWQNQKGLYFSEASTGKTAD